jgi:Zn-finger nucleic acid-binding protein
MDPVTYAGVTVQRCTRCQGIWFDGATYISLKKAPGAAKVDTGSASQGRKHDAMTGVLCPVCRTVLEAKPDLYQPHIYYDVCPNGDGVYFDAGEFRDFVKEDLTDFFKDLLAGKRNHH